jgi:hypothetical protein
MVGPGEARRKARISRSRRSADREDMIGLVAGLGSLIMALLAPFAVVGVLDTLVVSGDPTALGVKSPPRPRRL